MTAELERDTALAAVKALEAKCAAVTGERDKALEAVSAMVTATVQARSMLRTTTDEAISMLNTAIPA